MAQTVMLVDDIPNNLRLLQQILEDEGFRTILVDQSREVLEATRTRQPDIILLDVMMPDLDGFELCRLLKQDSRTSGIPVIMVTARTESDDLQYALELGAFDYIKKPFDEVEVIARVKSALKYKESRERLEEMASKDGLTQVYNHQLLMELFEKEYIRSDRERSNLAYVMIDIDRFKQINDSFGHQTGDEVLQAVAAILSRRVRRSDIVGRYGGEEFGIVLSGVAREEVVRLCEAIRQEIAATEFHREDRTLRISISMGICHQEAGGKLGMREMISRADQALYRAKQKGRNRVEVFEFWL